MAIENVTASIAIRKMTFETSADLVALRRELIDEHQWYGGIFNAQGLGTDVTVDKLQMTSPTGDVLVVDLHSTVVAVVHGVYTAMTEDEYQARYGEGA